MMLRCHGCWQGKTHTLVGTASDPGITTRSVNDLFSSLKAGAARGTDFLVRVSYVELYNEEIKDLLSNDPSAKLEIKGRYNIYTI